jgi:hypothetical protein
MALFRKLGLFIFILALYGSTAYAQIDYAIFRDSAVLRAEDSGKLSLQVDNLAYLRNYEYFGDIPLSYTLFGYQLIPQLKYQLNQQFSLKGGIFLRREFGREGFTDIEPVLTARYQKKSFSFLLGTLEGSLNHRFIEPIYNVESLISDRLEQGVQVIINKERLWLDWFGDWEKAIVRNDPYREEFTSGLSSRLKLVDNDMYTLEVPVQALVAHKGGQIDSSGLPVEWLLNTAVGASLSLPVRSSFLTGIRTEHYYAYYRDMSYSSLPPAVAGTLLLSLNQNGILTSMPAIGVAMGFMASGVAPYIALYQRKFQAMASRIGNWSS